MLLSMDDQPGPLIGTLDALCAVVHWVGWLVILLVLIDFIF